MAASLAVIRVLEAEGGLDLGRDVAFVAGHSLGEYSALAAAGALGVGDAARLLKRRGEAMQRAVPVGEGAMAALIGLDAEAARVVAAKAARAGHRPRRGVHRSQRQRAGPGSGQRAQKRGRTGDCDRPRAWRAAFGDVAGQRAVSFAALGPRRRCNGSRPRNGCFARTGGAARRQCYGATGRRPGQDPAAPGAAGDGNGALAGERAVPRRRRRRRHRRNWQRAGARGPCQAHPSRCRRQIGRRAAPRSRR